MSYAYLIDPNKQFQGLNGSILVGGFLKVYYSQTDDIVTTYKNFNLVENPEQIILDSNGRTIVIADESYSYKIEVYTNDGALLWTCDPINCSIGGGDGGMRYTFIEGEGINISQNGNNVTIAADLTNLSVESFLQIESQDEDNIVVGINETDFKTAVLNAVSTELNTINNTLLGKQNTLTAGNFIDISSDVISTKIKVVTISNSFTEIKDYVDNGYLVYFQALGDNALYPLQKIDSSEAHFIKYFTTNANTLQFTIYIVDNNGWNATTYPCAYVNTQNKLIHDTLGNAATSTKWLNPITLNFSGAISGSVSIDGSQNENWETFIANKKILDLSTISTDSQNRTLLFTYNKLKFWVYKANTSPTFDNLYIFSVTTVNDETITINTESCTYYPHQISTLGTAWARNHTNTNAQITQSINLDVAVVSGISSTWQATSSEWFKINGYIKDTINNEVYRFSINKTNSNDTALMEVL